MNKVILRPGGKIIHLKTNDDGGIDEIDINLISHCYLCDFVVMEEGFVLFDLLNILMQNPRLREVFKRDWVDEYLKAAYDLNAPFVKDESIEYLELYNIWEKNSKTGVIEGINRYSFHGVGKVLEEDYVESGNLIARKGTRIHYGLEFKPIKEIMHLPLIYNPEIRVQEGDPIDWQKYGRKLETVRVETITLMQLINSVFWELSYHGSPEENQALIADMEAKIIKALEVRDVI